MIIVFLELDANKKEAFAGAFIVGIEMGLDLH